MRARGGRAEPGFPPLPTRVPPQSEARGAAAAAAAASSSGRAPWVPAGGRGAAGVGGDGGAAGDGGAGAGAPGPAAGAGADPAAPPAAPEVDADDRGGITLGSSGIAVTLATALHRECDPGNPTAYAFLGMDRDTVRAVDEGDARAVARWARAATLVPGFRFSPGVPYHPAHLSPFHKGQRAPGRARVEAPRLMPHDGAPTERIVGAGGLFRRPEYLRQFLSPDGTLRRRQAFPYLAKKHFKRVVRGVKTARQMALLDVFTDRAGGQPGRP